MEHNKGLRLELVHCRGKLVRFRLVPPFANETQRSCQPPVIVKHLVETLGFLYVNEGWSSENSNGSNNADRLESDNSVSERS